MTTPKNKRKFGWMKRLVNGGKEGESSLGPKDVVTSQAMAFENTTEPTPTATATDVSQTSSRGSTRDTRPSGVSRDSQTRDPVPAQENSVLEPNSFNYSADNSASDNDSVYSQPPPDNSADFYGQMYDAHNSSQLYPSRMDNSSTEGIKSVRDNHSMRSASVLTDMAQQPAGSTIGSPRSIAKSVGWHSVGSRSPKSIKSTDSLKSGIVGNSWRRRDYYKFLTDEDSDGSITGDNQDPAGPSNHIRIDTRGSNAHPHSPLAQSHSSSLMFDAEEGPEPSPVAASSTAPHHHSSLADNMVNAESDGSLHGLGVSMEGLSVAQDNENTSNNGNHSNNSISESTEGEPQVPRSIRNGHTNGTNGSVHNTNPNAAARSTSYSSSLSTSGFASPSIMSQNSDGASTSYTVPSGMHHVQLPQQQHHQGHQGQNLQVNTVPNLDNASIITLASSSKRRRRRSVDTMASTRGIAPASLYVNRSVESLPMDTDTETNHSVER